MRIFVVVSAEPSVFFFIIWEIEIVMNSQWWDEREAVLVTTVVQNDGYYSSSRYALLSSSSSSSFAVAESGLPLSPGLSSIPPLRNAPHQLIRASLQYSEMMLLFGHLRLCAGVKTAEGRTARALQIAYPACLFFLVPAYRK